MPWIAEWVNLYTGVMCIVSLLAHSTEQMGYHHEPDSKHREDSGSLSMDFDRFWIRPLPEASECSTCLGMKSVYFNPILKDTLTNRRSIQKCVAKDVC